MAEPQKTTWGPIQRVGVATAVAPALVEAQLTGQSFNLVGEQRVADTSTAALVTALIALLQPKTCIGVTGSISGNTAIVAAVPGKRIKVFAVEWETAYSAGTISPILTDGNGGTSRDLSLFQAPASGVMGKVKTASPPAYLFGTTIGTALYMNPNGQTVSYTVNYFADDAT